MTSLRTLKKGLDGSDVLQWQLFLIGQGLYLGKADRQFGKLTEAATIQFQKAHNLLGDGLVGPMTYAKAIELGLPVVVDKGQEWPPKPNIKFPANNNERGVRWGVFKYTSSPTTSDNPERIAILGDWVTKNITSVICPVFKIKVNLNVRCADDYVKLMETWKKEGLSHLLLTHEGAFAPRFIRGSRSSLSNHAWGSAFDVNYQWNQLGKTPAYVGQKGSVRELVPIANELGWFWGGHFTRKDGMHFEKV